MDSPISSGFALKPRVIGGSCIFLVSATVVMAAHALLTMSSPVDGASSGGARFGAMVVRAQAVASLISSWAIFTFSSAIKQSSKIRHKMYTVLLSDNNMPG